MTVIPSPFLGDEALRSVDSVLIDCGTNSGLDNCERLEGSFSGRIDSDGLAATDWDASVCCVMEAAVVATTAAVVGVDECVIFLVALIGLGSTGAQSEHSSQNVSIDVSVKTSLFIVLCSDEDTLNGVLSTARGLIHLKTELPFWPLLTWGLGFTFEVKDCHIY